MTKVLLIVFLFSSAAMAGQKYGFNDPRLEDEMSNNYKEHAFPNWVNAKGSSATLTYLNVSTLTINGVNYSAAPSTVESSSVTGTTAGDNASAGRLGEYVITADGGTVSAGTSGQFVNYQTTVLTAGDWDVWGAIQLDRNGANVTAVRTALSLFSDNTTTDHSTGYNLIQLVDGLTATDLMQQVGPFRVNVTGNTTVHLKQRWDYTTATPRGIGGKIWARRVR